MSLESIVPIIGDALAIKILGIWKFNQTDISELTGISQKIVDKKIRLLKTCGLISENGIISEEASKLLLAVAAKNMKK